MKSKVFLQALLLFFTILTPSIVYAQEIEKFFPSGTTWQEVRVAYPYEPIVRTYVVGQDTLINERAYKSIWVDGEERGRWIREADNKVWLLRNDFQEELQIYDFNWEVGKTLYKQFYKEGIGLSADTIKIDTLQTLTLEDGQPYDYIEYPMAYTTARMIKDIGTTTEVSKESCIVGSFELEIPLPLIAEYRLLTFTRNDTLIYKDEALMNKLSVSPFYYSNNAVNGTAHDLQGRPADGTQKGVIVKNGKKMLVR